MLRPTLKRIAELRETEIPAAKLSEDYKKLAELQVELTSLLNSLRPVFKAMGQHVRRMNKGH